MSWYRTYRPQTIGGLHIPSVRAALERVRVSGSFSHAYLFCGPKGTGKTSSARILAKMLNCKKNAKAVEQFLATGKALKDGFVEPCGECSFCTSITLGNSMNVTEMDAASNRGIDDIRLLRERVHLAPTDGAVSVYIIDEVHMLTTEAFNALLKVLEEPPKHVVFALATTELHKVPETVVSRCTMVLYKKAAVEDIVAALTGALKKEGIKADEDVLKTIAEQADGSFRDAIKALENIASGRKTITAKDLVEGQRSSAGEAGALFEALQQRDVQAVAGLFQQLSENDSDIIYLQKQLLKLVHQQMVEAVDKKDIMRAGQHAALLAALNTPLDPLIPVPYLPFEIACMSWCLGAAFKQPSQQRTPPQKSQTSLKEEEKPVQTELEKVVEQVVEEEMTEDDVQMSVPASASQIDIALLTARWPEILKEVRVTNASVEALLRAARPARTEGQSIVVEVFYPFHKEQLEHEKHRHLIETIMMQLFAVANVKLSFVLGKKKAFVKADAAAGDTKKDEELEKAATEAFM